MYFFNNDYPIKFVGYRSILNSSKPYAIGIEFTHENMVYVKFRLTCPDPTRSYIGRSILGALPVDIIWIERNPLKSLYMCRACRSFSKNKHACCNESRLIQEPSFLDEV